MTYTQTELACSSIQVSEQLGRFVLLVSRNNVLNRADTFRILQRWVCSMKQQQRHQSTIASNRGSIVEWCAHLVVLRIRICPRIQQHFRDHFRLLRQHTGTVKRRVPFEISLVRVKSTRSQNLTGTTTKYKVQRSVHIRQESNIFKACAFLCLEWKSTAKLEWLSTTKLRGRIHTSNPSIHSFRQHC